MIPATIVDCLVAELRVVLCVALPLLQLAILLVIGVLRGILFVWFCLLGWLLVLLLISRYNCRVLLLEPVVLLGLHGCVRPLNNLEVFDLIDFENDGWDSVLTTLDFIFPVPSPFSTE